MKTFQQEDDLFKRDNSFGAATGFVEIIAVFQESSTSHGISVNLKRMFFST